jgi:hypothetical protein
VREAPEGHRVRVRVRVPIRRRRSLRRVRQAAGRGGWVAMGLILILAIISVIPGLSARSGLEETRAALLEGRAALARAEVTEARDAFVQAEASLLAAQRQLDNPAVRAVSYVPLVGRTPDAATAVVEAGLLISQAGSLLAGAVNELPEGVAALAPRAGRIPLGPLGRVAQPLAEARDLLDRAAALLAAAPEALVLTEVDEARDELLLELREARRLVRIGAALAGTMPLFLGAEGTRRYFVGAQNPAELRGTGGLIGSYAILTVRNGRLDLGDFVSVTKLPTVPVDQVRPPDPSYAERYDPFQARGYWSNINMTPDFPTAAVAIERLFRKVTGTRLDGVIVADPMALADLTRVTGPAVVPSTGKTLRADDVVDYVTNEAYAALPDQESRQGLLGEAAQEVLDRFLAGGADPLSGGKALSETAAGGHLLIHATDPQVQAGLVAAGVTGGVGGSRGDYLSVITNNAGGNKTDFYLDRTIKYVVNLGAEGTASGRARIRLHNDAPTEGQPRYVIGPFSRRFKAGQNVTYLSTYCAATCLMDGFRMNGRQDTVGSQLELGRPVFPTFLRMASGDTTTLQYALVNPAGWEGGAGSGRYRLTFRGQTTIRPTRLVVDVRAPDGFLVTRATEGMDISGNRAVWRGDAGHLQTFDVFFERRPLSKIWHGVLDFLGRPVFGRD